MLIAMLAGGSLVVITAVLLFRSRRQTLVEPTRNCVRSIDEDAEF